jgi:hypothetical protein
MNKGTRKKIQNIYMLTSKGARAKVQVVNFFYYN